MLIGIDASRAVSSKRTGTETYAFFLIQALIPLAAARGHHLRLYFGRHQAHDLFQDAGNVSKVTISLPRLWTHLGLAQELHRRPPDLFFTPAHVIPLSYHGPSVATVHDLGYHHFPEAHPWSQFTYLRWSTRHNARRSVRVIADSQATKSDLVTLYQVDSSKVDVIYPGVDPGLAPVRERRILETVTRKYGIDKPYFLHLGTLHPRKNLARLIKAFVASGSQHLLVLAGKTGWLAQPLLSQIHELDPEIRGRMLLPGFVDDNDKAALLSGATALLYPTLYEGFGFPVLEAQICGTPVLCANSSSLPEIAGNGALLIDPQDQEALTSGIKELTANQALREKLIEAGMNNARRFTWQLTAEGVLATLENASRQ